MNEVKEKSWEEFRNNGLLWWTNLILHMFGWAIVCEIENSTVKRVYPARVSYRGFGEEQNTEGYIKVSEYLRENIEELTEEAKA